MYLVKANHKILLYWVEHMIGDIELIPTDIIKIINKAWVKSFAEVEPNKKSSSECRWFPYNWNIIMHKQLHYTMIMKDIKTEKNVHWCNQLP